MKLRTKFLSALAVAALALGAASNSYAVATISINGVVVATDEGIGDAATGIPGLVSYSGSASGFQFTMDNGTSKPNNNGTATTPIQSLTISALALTSGGTVVIEFSDTGYTSPASASAFASLVANSTPASAGTSIKYETFINGTLLTSITDPNGAFGMFTASSSPGAAAGTNYTLTQRVTLVSEAGPSRSFGVTAVVSVPDGGATVALLGSAFLGLAMIRRKVQVAA